jgi:Domain of unknown function (DUF222)
LPLVAQALETGSIGEDHLRAITGSLDKLASCVSVTDLAEVERGLVREAAKHDAEIVKAVGRRVDEIFNPDGVFDGADRTARAHFE